MTRKKFSLSDAKGSFECLDTKKNYNIFSGGIPGLENVPTAIAGSINPGLKWQVGGGGQNGQLNTLCQNLGVLPSVNSQLKKDKTKLEETSQNLVGCITQIDLEKEAPGKDKPFKKVLYSSSPDLNGLDTESAKKSMQQFGREFRRNLNEQKIDEVVMPLFSGGIYRGGNDRDDVAKWMMQGWFAEEEKLQKEPGYVPTKNVYFSAPEFTQDTLQQANDTRSEALVGTKIRSREKIVEPESTHKKPQSPDECIAVLKNSVANSADLKIVNSPAGNPQAQFSFNSKEDLNKTIEQLKNNEKLNSKESPVGEKWQVKEKDGNFTLTLRSSETFLLCGYGKGDRGNFHKNMDSLLEKNSVEDQIKATVSAIKENKGTAQGNAAKPENSAGREVLTR